MHPLVSLTLLRPPYSMKHSYDEIRPFTNPTMAPKCSHERKGHTFLSVSQKLEMIKLIAEGMSKAKMGQKLGLLCQKVSQVVNANHKFLKEIKSTIPGNT